MPPYTPVVSRDQSRKLFALARRGEISLAEAKGKTRAADWSHLPEHAPHRKTTLRAIHDRAKKGGRK